MLFYTHNIELCGFVVNCCEFAHFWCEIMTNIRYVKCQPNIYPKHCQPNIHPKDCQTNICPLHFQANIHHTPIVWWIKCPKCSKFPNPQNRFAFVWSHFHGCLCLKLNKNETKIQLKSIIETTFYLLNRNDKANLIFWKALQSNWVSLLTNPTGLYLKLSFDQFKNVKIWIDKKIKYKL